MEDPRVYELLSLLLDEARENRKAIAKLEVRTEMGQERTTQAILSLTSLLQKAIIDPAAHQAEEIAALKQRVEALEQSR